MHNHPSPALNRHRGRLPLLLLPLPLLAFAGCAPAERIADPVNWPTEWDRRSLWATPNAFIYAARGASAGEIDRLVERVQREYATELDQPTPPVLIIVRDAGEPLPGNDVRALLRGTLRVALEREPDQPAEGRTPDAPRAQESEAPQDQHSETSGQSRPEKVEEALSGLIASAAATGTTLEVIAGTMPLTCDAQTLREACQAPAGLVAQGGDAVILPTRACLRTHVRRMMQAALKLYGIGPVAQALFTPVLAIAETKTVDQLDRLRDIALFNHWLFEHADLPIQRKREIAAAKIESLGASAESAAESIIGMTE